MKDAKTAMIVFLFVLVSYAEIIYIVYILPVVFHILDTHGQRFLSHLLKMEPKDNNNI